MDDDDRDKRAGFWEKKKINDTHTYIRTYIFLFSKRSYIIQLSFYNNVYNIIIILSHGVGTYYA